MKKPEFVKAASVETPELRAVKKTSSMEAQEVANLPDFVKISDKNKKPSAQEMLD